MSTEANRALIGRFVECFKEFWRTGDADLLDEFVAPDFVTLRTR